MALACLGHRVYVSQLDYRVSTGHMSKYLPTVLFACVCVFSGPAVAKSRKSYRAIRHKTWTLQRDKQYFGESRISAAAKAKVKQHGCAGDAHGHIRANAMGGKGTANNIFPLNPSVNSGAFAQWEKHIVELLNTTKKRQHIFDRLKLEVSFSFDKNSLRPKRPTKVVYCYRGRRLDPNTGHRSSVHECKEFANPAPASCNRDEDFEKLVKQVNKHLKQAREARKTALNLEDSFLNRACRRDFERLGDHEWSAANKDYKKNVQAKVEPRFKSLEREHNRLIRELIRFKRKPPLKARAQKKHDELDAGHRTLQNARKGQFTAGGSLRFRAAREFNIKQHKKLQKQMGCDRIGDGDAVADCRVDKPPRGARGVQACTFYELAPHNYAHKGMLRARAQKRARAFNRKTRGKRFADVQGGSRCEGRYKWKLKLYRGCDFKQMPGRKSSRPPAKHKHRRSSFHFRLDRNKAQRALQRARVEKQARKFRRWCKHNRRKCRKLMRRWKRKR